MADETGKDERAKQGMADDIVTRLREQAQAPALAWLSEAADEIERLRAAGETLARAVATYCGDEAWADRALDAWQEARRG